MKPLTLCVLLLLSGVAGGLATLAVHARGDDDGQRLLELDARVGGLDQRLESLAASQREQTRAVDGLRRSPGEVDRSQELSQADLEAALEALLSRRPDLAPGMAEAPEALAQDATPPARGSDDYFALLVDENLTDQQRQDLWEQVRAAGLADELLARFEQLAEENPYDSMAQMALGVAYLEALQGLPNGPKTGALAAQADAAFDRALELDPDNWDARFVKGLALSFWPPIFGKQAEAIAQFETLRERQAGQTHRPEHLQTFLLLGNLYQQTGKDAQAMEVWIEGYELFPDSAELAARITGQ